MAFPNKFARFYTMSLISRKTPKKPIIHAKVKEMLLNTSEATWHKLGNWDKWDYSQREKIIGMKSGIYRLEVEQTESVDECLKIDNWDLWYDFEEKIKKIKGSIKQIEEDIDERMCREIMFLDLNNEL